VLRSTRFQRRGQYSGTPFDLVVLDHQERHLRRRRIKLVHEDSVMVDLPATALLEHGDALELDDGRLVEVIAAEEELYEITGHNGRELAELAWHIGNRHLAAQIEEGRILILRDAVIREMLLGLGAHVRQVSEPFHPARGAYAGHGHDHGHDHHHDGHPHG
jgi:urease accessory protein